MPREIEDLLDHVFTVGHRQLVDACKAQKRRLDGRVARSGELRAVFRRHEMDRIVDRTMPVAHILAIVVQGGRHRRFLIVTGDLQHASTGQNRCIDRLDLSLRIPKPAMHDRQRIQRRQEARRRRPRLRQQGLCSLHVVALERMHAEAVERTRVPG